MSINDLLRDPLKGSSSYVAGAAITDMSDPEISKLNANENMLGPSPMAIEAMAAELKNGYLYPMPVFDALKTKLADFYKLPKDNFTLFNGSGAGINAIADAFLNPGDEMVISSPTYMAYAPLPAHYGAKIVEVSSIDDLYTDLDAILEGITDKTKLIFICNPNNPTGTLLDNDKLDAFMAKVPKHVITVIDEAYFHWIDIPYESAFRFVNSMNNVIVLRTFSKIYGMAGIRCGFAAANAEITAALYTASNIFYSNRIAAAGAMAALDDEKHYTKVFNNNMEQRNFMTAEMEKLGIDVVPSQTSFIYFNAHCDGDKCIEFLKERKVFIRPFPQPYLRVSIGLPWQNEAFLEAMKAFLVSEGKEIVA